MIILTKMNGQEFALNCDLIETISERPDTTINLTNGNIYLVQEDMEEVIRRITTYRQEIFRDMFNGRF